MKKTVKNNNRKTKRYGSRFFAVGESITNDTRVSGLANHDVVLGSTGSGKTGGYVIPLIQNIDGSLVVSDTKGLLERRFRDELIKKGYKVRVIDFVNPTRSCGYNPLKYIRRLDDGTIKEQDILSVAKLICPRLDNRDPFWDCCAAGYMAFLIGYCMATDDPKDQNLKRIGELRSQFSQPNGDLLFTDWVYEHHDSLTAKKFHELMAYRIADKTWASVEAFISCHLEPFYCREMLHIFAREDKDCFDINDLGREKTVLFINQSDTDRAFDRVVNLLQVQIMQTLCSQADANPDGMLDVPVRLILDDFGASTRMPDFDKVISVMRSRDIAASLIIQSMTQLESMYSHDTAITIINNCDNLLFLGTNDQETAEYVAYRAETTIEKVMRMPRDSAYLIRSGERARLVKKIRPYSTCADYIGKEKGECACG